MKRIILAILAFALPLSAATLTLTWIDNATNETGFRLERKIEDGQFVLLADLPPDTERFVDDMAVAGMRHTYRVNAYNAGGDSEWSNEASATPNVVPNAPSAPGTLQVSQPGRLVNISGRGQVGIDADIHIGGFVVTGDEPVTVLIRGVGPELTRLGVPNVLADPQLVLFRSPQTEIARNDDWGDDPAIAAAAASVFAFTLAPGSKDAALLIEVDPGQYTVHLSGVGNTTGVGLLEIYEVAPSP